MNNILIVFRNLLTKAFGRNKLDIYLLLLLLAVFFFGCKLYYNILQIPFFDENISVKSFGKSNCASGVSLDLVSIGDIKKQRYRYYGNGNRIRILNAAEKGALVYLHTENYPVVKVKIDSVQPVYKNEKDIFFPFSMTESEVKQIKKIATNIDEDYIKGMTGAVMIQHTCKTNTYSNSKMHNHEERFRTANDHTGDDQIFIRNGAGIVEIPRVYNDVHSKVDTIVYSIDGELSDQIQIIAEYPDGSHVEMTSSLLEMVDNIEWDSVCHLNKLLQVEDYSKNGSVFTATYLQETRTSYLEVIYDDVMKSHLLHPFLAAYDISQERRMLKVNVDLSSCVDEDSSSSDVLHVWTPRSSSELYTETYISPTAPSCSNINTISLNMVEGYEITSVFPEPDTVLKDLLLYSNPLKIIQIERDGLTAFVKYPHLQNIQMARIFILTTLITLVLTAIINVIVRMLNNRKIILFAKRNEKKQCYASYTDCSNCPLMGTCQKITNEGLS